MLNCFINIIFYTFIAVDKIEEKYNVNKETKQR
jgi:uncharacterized membrane protein